jgi:Dna[CI] antecedent, DciA
MESVRTGLRQVMSNLLRGRPVEEAVLLAWPLVCGKEVAARTQAVAFSEGQLTVEVPDAAWRSQLHSFAPRYLSEYQSLLGPAVRSVEFKLKQSAVSTQQSAKPVLSASTNRPLSSAKRHFQKKRGSKG